MYYFLFIAFLGKVACCAQRAGLCAGWEIAFRLPVTGAQFINLSSLFVLLLIDVHQAGTEADACI
jgi:hypothetical protein